MIHNLDPLDYFSSEKKHKPVERKEISYAALTHNTADQHEAEVGLFLLFLISNVLVHLKQCRRSTLQQASLKVERDMGT